MRIAAMLTSMTLRKTSGLEHRHNLGSLPHRYKTNTARRHLGQNPQPEIRCAGRFPANRRGAQSSTDEARWPGGARLLQTADAGRADCNRPEESATQRQHPTHYPAAIGGPAAQRTFIVFLSASGVPHASLSDVAF